MLRCNSEMYQPLLVNVYGVKSADCMDSLHIEFADQRCEKETCIDVLFFNLVFQINFQAVFLCDCA